MCITSHIYQMYGVTSEKEKKKKLSRAKRGKGKTSDVTWVEPTRSQWLGASPWGTTNMVPPL